MDLPGIPKAAIRISIARDSIEVSGERPRPAKGEIDMRPVWLERPGGEFKRILALPPDAETDDVSAEMKDGVLEIRVPRSGPGRSVSIQ
jgi:HSP20 family protein